MPARGAVDSVYRDLCAVGRYASLWSFGLQFLGFRYAPPRLYAIARHRGLAYFVANDFLRKATWIASALKESFREHSKT